MTEQNAGETSWTGIPSVAPGEAFSPYPMTLLALKFHPLGFAAFHAVGGVALTLLGHPLIGLLAFIACSTMEPRYDRGQTGLRTFENDDQRGICAIYPSSDQRTSDETGGVSSITIKALACSTAPPTPTTATATSPGGCSCRAAGVGAGLGLSDVALGAAVLAGLAARARRRRA